MTKYIRCYTWLWLHVTVHQCATHCVPRVLRVCNAVRRIMLYFVVYLEMISETRTKWRPRIRDETPCDIMLLHRSARVPLPQSCPPYNQVGAPSAIPSEF